MIIPRPDGLQMTLEDVKADVEASKIHYPSDEFCFTAVYVEALVNLIEKLKAEKKVEIVYVNPDDDAD